MLPLPHCFLWVKQKKICDFCSFVMRKFVTWPCIAWWTSWACSLRVHLTRFVAHANAFFNRRRVQKTKRTTSSFTKFQTLHYSWLKEPRLKYNYKWVWELYGKDPKHYKQIAIWSFFFLETSPNKLLHPRGQNHLEWRDRRNITARSCQRWGVHTSSQSQTTTL